MTPGSRYVQLLTRQQPNMNNGTVPGGLAHMLQQGLMGYAGRQDGQQQTEAQRALVDGLGAKPWVNPDTGQVAPGTEGGFEGASRMLSGMADNPYAGRMASELLMQQAKMQAEADARQRQFQLEQRFNPPQTREIARGDQTITQQWNPQTQTFEEVGAAPRWQPQQLTPQQQAFAQLTPEQQAAYFSKPQTSVNVGTATQFPGLSKLGEGYTYLYNPDGTPKIDERGMPMASPIPGSEAEFKIQDAERKQQELEDKATARQETKANTARLMTDTIGRARNLISNSTIPVTGLLGQMGSAMAGTPAHNLKNLLEAVKANIGFEALNTMRQESPNGAALGNVTERELAFLQAAAGSLLQSQTEDQLLYNLNKLEERANEVIHYGLSKSPSQGGTGNQPVPSGGWSIERIE